MPGAKLVPSPFRRNRKAVQWRAGASHVALRAFGLLLVAGLSGLVLARADNADTYLVAALILGTIAGIVIRLPARIPLLTGLVLLTIVGSFLVIGQDPAQWVGDVAFVLIVAGVVLALFEPTSMSD